MPAQPLAVEQMGAGDNKGIGVASVMTERLPVGRVRVWSVCDQRPAPRHQGWHPGIGDACHPAFELERTARSVIAPA